MCVCMAGVSPDISDLEFHIDEEVEVCYLVLLAEV